MHASATSLHHRGNSSLSRLPLQRYNTNLPGPAPSFIPPVNGFPSNYPLNAQQDMHPLYSPQFAYGPYTQQPSFGNLSQYATTINNVQHFYPQQQSPATAPLFDFASNPTSVQPSAPASSSSSSDQSRQAIGQDSDRLNVQTAAAGNQSFTPTNPPPISDIAPRILVCEPGQGEVTGGLMVNIRGHGFIPGVQVLFDGIAATETICHDQSRLICTVPPAAKAGPVPVSCNLPGAHSDAMFTYIDSTDRDEVMLALGTLEAKSQGLQGRAALDLANQRLHKEKDYAGFRFGNGAGPTDGSLESSLMHVLDLIDMDGSPHVADFDLQGSNGHALLHFGAFKGQYRFIAGLLARSANPNIRDLNGMTPMHLAVMQKQPKVVRKLRASGADPGLRSLAGYLPVDMAPNKEMLKLFDVLETELPSSVCPTPLSLSRRGSTGSQRPSRDPYLWDRPGANLYNSEDEDDADDYSTDRTESLCIPAVAPKITSRRSSFKLQDDSKETETVTHEKLLSSTDTAQMIQRIQRTWQSFQEAVHNFEGLGFTAQFQNMQAAMQGWPLPVPAFHSPFRPMSPNLQANEMIRRWSPFAQQSWSSEATDMDDKTKDTVPAKKTEAWGNFLDRIPSLGLSPPSYDEVCPGGSKQQPTSLDVKKQSEKQAQVDAMFNNAAEARFGSPNTTVVQTKATPFPKTITPRVRNDKRFLFWWLPLLFTLAYFLFGSPLSALPTIVEPVVSFARDLVPARIVGDL